MGHAVTSTRKAPAGEQMPSPSAGTPTEVVSADSLLMQQKLVKSLLPAGGFMTDDHRYYFNGEGPVPSVTTVLEILDKPALATWKAQQAVKALYHSFQDDDPRPFNGLDEAVKWAMGEVRKSRDGAASIGTGVHHLADMASRADRSDAEAFGVTDDTRPYLEAFKAFREALHGLCLRQQ